MTSGKTPLELGKRERQILETVQRLGEASVAEVRLHLADPPSYSAVRTILGLLAKKGWLKHRHEGKRYLYRPAAAKQQSQRTALRRLLGTFFDGSPGDAVAALLDISAGSLSEDELGRLTELIDKARRENRGST
jgi:BlaI family transcriptional regulator, penicillinase repressor